MGETNIEDALTLPELEEKIFDIIPDLKNALEKPKVKNPFKSTMQLKAVDKIQLVLLFILVPIRLLIVLLLILIAGVMSKLLLIGFYESDPPVPMQGIRRKGQVLVWALARTLAFTCGFHNIHVKGKLEGGKEAPVVVLAPHSGFMDAFIISVLGNLSAVSREENLLAPVIGNAVRLLYPVSVRRTEKNSRLKVVKQIKQRALNGTWPPVLLFPEGTCTNHQALVTFKPGAFYPAVPVQPVVLRYLDELDYVSWTWDGPSVLQLLCIMMTRPSNKAEIEILPVYYPSEEEKSDAFLYARNVRKLMADKLSIPVTDHSFEDCRLMGEAKKLGLPTEAGLVEFYKLSPMIGMSCECMMDYLKKFARIDKTKDGVIDLQEFCDYLNLPPSQEVQIIFRIYDIEKDGHIQFSEYLLGVFLISQPFNTHENIQTGFELFESEEHPGFITMKSFSAVLIKVMQLKQKYISLLFEDMDKENNGKVDFHGFKEFCLNKPEYALLFIHFRKLDKRKSEMTVSRSELRRSSSISEFQMSLLENNSDSLPEVFC